jgi:hypothetical protein
VVCGSARRISGRRWGFVNELTGVWLGDRPMDINDDAKGDKVLRVELPDDVDLGDVEVIEDGKPYRLGATIWRGYLDPPFWIG